MTINISEQLISLVLFNKLPIKNDLTIIRTHRAFLKPFSTELYRDMGAMVSERLTFIVVPASPRVCRLERCWRSALFHHSNDK